MKTKSALDFERKSSYRVTMGVFDSKGGSSTITVTITVTDVADVPLANGPTQMIGVVDSEEDTEVSTLDGSVAVTIPSGSRSDDYQVRLDYGTTNCDLAISGEDLWFCLTVDIFDNAGNLEQGVTLSQPATIKIRRNGDERAAWMQYWGCTRREASASTPEDRRAASGPNWSSRWNPMAWAGLSSPSPMSAASACMQVRPTRQSRCRYHIR